MSEQVSVRARFERFPATVKGAFILRGEDADPHQVEWRGASVVAIGSRASSPVPMAVASLDIVPHRDVFVPFELPITELEPGWYTLEAQLEVDGTSGVFDGGRRFAVPWPRATVRRGQVRVDRVVEVGDATVTVEHVDCAGDSAKVHLRVEPPGPLTISLEADGERIEVLEMEADEGSGRVKATTYPVLRTHRGLRLELRGASRAAVASLEIPLPE